MNIAEPLRHLAVPIAELVPDPRNARRHPEKNLAAIRGSLERFGQQKPIVVGPGNVIIAGNGTLEAAKLLGWSHVAAVRSDLAGQEAAAFAIADNRTAELAVWNDEQLAETLRDMGEDIAGAVGFSDAELAKIIGAAQGLADEDVPETLPAAVSRAGDLWSMGDHRLLCGDCTNGADVQRVMGGGVASMAFVDPPWNVAIGQDSNPRHLQRPGLANDSMSAADFSAFLNAFAGELIKVLDGDLYCVLGASEWPSLDAALRAQGFHWSATVIWVKDLFVLGRSKYHRRYEPIWYGWPSRGSSSFGEARDQDDVWECPRPRKSEEHPTMKPAELVGRAIRNSSVPGGVVFDGFCGSGTTVIASEQLGRRCRAIELEPAYVDVAVRRWQKLTGSDAILEENGRSWAQTAGDRGVDVASP